MSNDIIKIEVNGPHEVIKVENTEVLLKDFCSYLRFKHADFSKLDYMGINEILKGFLGHRSNWNGQE